MNGRAQYSPEYVELRTAIERATARIEGLQSMIQSIQHDLARTEAVVMKNRSDLGAIKITASLLGAVAGACFGLFGWSWRSFF